jgi:hypothetical protein
MPDTTAAPDDVAPNHAETPPSAPDAPGGPSVDDLDQRINRLEDVVAALCDNTQGMEDRLAAKLASILRAESERARAEYQAHAGHDPTHPSEAYAAAHEPPSPPPSWATFSVGDLTLVGSMWWDVRTFVRMVRDPLYAMSWTSKVVLIIAAIYIAWLVIFGIGGLIPFVSNLISIVTLMLVSYVVFKVVGRELRRYHEFTLRRWR